MNNKLITVRDFLSILADDDTIHIFIKEKDCCICRVEVAEKILSQEILNAVINYVDSSVCNGHAIYIISNEEDRDD